MPDATLYGKALLESFANQLQAGMMRHLGTLPSVFIIQAAYQLSDVVQHRSPVISGISLTAAVPREPTWASGEAAEVRAPGVCLWRDGRKVFTGFGSCRCRKQQEDLSVVEVQAHFILASQSSQSKRKI